jgi:hypothetical protein
MTARRPLLPATGEDRPVVAVDVDDVLSPDDPPTATKLGYQPHHYDGPSPTGEHVTGTVWLHPDHGDWLRELADLGAELVWCTSWGKLAGSWIAARLGLPADLPVIDVGPGGGIRWGHQLKLGPLYTWPGLRPVAVLDDEFGGKDASDADRRTAHGIPTLLVPINGVAGLRRADIDR